MKLCKCVYVCVYACVHGYGEVIVQFKCSFDDFIVVYQIQRL